MSTINEQKAYPDREAHTLYPNGIPMTALIVWVSEVF
jgi:hypothetical protein